MHERFCEGEIATLRKFGIVIFANRIIYEAQPPMSKKDIEAVQKYCLGPIPKPLLDLWSQTAGGRLPYRLSIIMDGNVEPLEWKELFYNGSDSYNDLKGWINHERKLTRAASGFNLLKISSNLRAKLTDLPIGGFDRTDRVYVNVSASPESGQVQGWSEGNYRRGDAFGTIAEDLYGAFEALFLEEDSIAEEGRDGGELAAFLETSVRAGLSRTLADKVLEYYRQAIVDWRTPLQQKTLAQNPLLANMALRQSIERDDRDLIFELSNAGVNLHTSIRGASPVEYAFALEKFQALEALIDLRAAVNKDILYNMISGAVPAPAMRALLQCGAEPTVIAIVQCASAGEYESARILAQACSASPDFEDEFARAKQRFLENFERSVTEVQAGVLHDFRGEEGLKNCLLQLKNFELTSSS